MKPVKLRSLGEPVDFYGKTWIVKTISKEDVEGLLKGNFKKQGNKLKIDDDKMWEIADKLGDALSDCYWISLEAILESMEE